MSDSNPLTNQNHYLALKNILTNVEKGNCDITELDGDNLTPEICFFNIEVTVREGKEMEFPTGDA